MKKLSIAISVVLILVLGLMTIVLLKIRADKEHQQRVVLAEELQRIEVPLSVDLSAAHEGSIQGVPADGLWHDRIKFIQSQLGDIEYVIKGGRLLRINQGRILMVAENIAVLRFRRQGITPDIIEVQIEAKKNVSMVSNLRIRTDQ